MSNKRELVEDPWRKPACFYDTDELFSGSDTEPLFGEVSESKRFDLSYLKRHNESVTSDNSNQPATQLGPSDSGMISGGSEAPEINPPIGGLSKLRCMQDPQYEDIRKAVQDEKQNLPGPESLEFGCPLPKDYYKNNPDFQPIAQTTGEIEAWLTKQTDLCRSKGKTVSGEKLWVGIPTQETKHVSDLISHQKSAKPKKTKKIARQSAKFAKSIEQAPPAQKGASSSTSKNSYRSSYGRKASKPSLSRRSSNASNTSQSFQRKPVNSPVVPACAGNSMKKSYEFDRRTDHTREEDRKEYETNTITIKRPPSVVEKSYSSTPTTDSSDEESYDKNAIISSIKKAHEQMRRNGSMKSSSENHEPRPESIRSMKDEARVGSVARTDSIRSAYDLPPACVDRRTPMSSSVLGEPKEAKLESLRDDTSVAKSEVSTIRSRKYGIDEMRQFIGLELKSHGDSMSISNILGLLNDDFMSGVLKRPGLSKEKFLNVLKMFEEFYVENGRVFLQNAESTEEEEDTEEDSSESISDSGTDVSELGMFGVPKPQTTLQNTAKPAAAIESEPMSSMARQVYDAKQELAALRLRDANLHTQLVQIQNRIAENKEEMEAAQEKYEQLADEFVERFMKAF